MSIHDRSHSRRTDLSLSRSRRGMLHATQRIVEQLENRKLLTAIPRVLGVDDGSGTPIEGLFTNFGELNPGAPLSRRFTLANDGDTALVPTNLRVTNLSGQPVTDFTITQGLSSAIPAGGSDGFTIRFSSNTVGRAERIVRFGTNSSTGEYDFRVLAVVVPPPPVVFVINGTTGNDTLRFNGSSYILNGTTVAVPAGRPIQINGLAGTDNITVAQTIAGANVSIDAGSEVDSITLGVGNLSTLAAPINVVGGNNGDSLTLNDTTAPAVVGDGRRYTVTGGAILIDSTLLASFTGVRNVTLNQSNNNDSNSVEFVAAGNTLTINSNGGNDFFELGQVSSSNIGANLEANLRGTLTVNGGSNGSGPGDTFSLNNFDSLKPSNFVMTASSITSPGSSGFRINYSGMEGASVNLSAAADLFNASAATIGLDFLTGGGPDTLLGGAGNDSFEGADVGVVINGGGGNDRITGSPGADSINGGAGNDTISAAEGSDSIDGGSGSDSIDGGDSSDRLYFFNVTTFENDTVVTSTDGIGDSIYAQAITSNMIVNLLSATFLTHSNRSVKTQTAGLLPTIRNVYAGSGNDSITGNNNRNEIGGGAGNDMIAGRGGDDFIYGDLGDAAGNDSLFGDDGNDTIFGEDGNDFISGGNNDDSLGEDDGESGTDTLVGGAGNDFAQGGFGNDTYAFSNAVGTETDRIAESGAGQIDTLDFSTVTGNLLVAMAAFANGNIVQMPGRNINNALPADATFEVVRGGSGNDAIDAQALPTVATIFGNAGRDTLVGFDGNDNLDGGAGDDLLAGLNGSDTLLGGAGNDNLQGAAGGDTYRFGPATVAETDTVTELTNAGTDRLDFGTLTTAVNVNLSSDTLATHTNRTVKTAVRGQFANIENATGGSAGDTLTGNAAGNNLVGNAGGDTLVGNAGNDILDGGAGNDRLTGNAGLDRLLGGADNDTFFAGDTEKDTLDGGTGTDILGSSDAIDVRSLIP
jgi:Ca2+-binding RTX toxin-like protein